MTFFHRIKFLIDKNRFSSYHSSRSIHTCALAAGQKYHLTRKGTLQVGKEVSSVNKSTLIWSQITFCDWCVDVLLTKSWILTGNPSFVAFWKSIYERHFIGKGDNIVHVRLLPTFWNVAELQNYFVCNVSYIFSGKLAFHRWSVENFLTFFSGNDLWSKVVRLLQREKIAFFSGVRGGTFVFWNGNCWTITPSLKFLFGEKTKEDLLPLIVTCQGWICFRFVVCIFIGENLRTLH